MSLNDDSPSSLSDDSLSSLKNLRRCDFCFQPFIVWQKNTRRGKRIQRHSGLYPLRSVLAERVFAKVCLKHREGE